jgi:hypothetical protein
MGHRIIINTLVYTCLFDAGSNRFDRVMALLVRTALTWPRVLMTLSSLTRMYVDLDLAKFDDPVRCYIKAARG